MLILQFNSSVYASAEFTIQRCGQYDEQFVN